MLLTAEPPLMISPFCFTNAAGGMQVTKWPSLQLPGESFAIIARSLAGAWALSSPATAGELHLEFCQQGADVLINGGPVLLDQIHGYRCQAEFLLGPLHVHALVVLDGLPQLCQLHHMQCSKD